ncbi:benzoyl-CoA 2,3-epoxidase subunit BoxA [Advenella incenata]
MATIEQAQVIKKQHLIDPEICIRCNTCEETCPIDAITHDGTNYVVKPDVCNHCMACVAPCPTGAIDNWQPVHAEKMYSIDEQYTWDELPAPLALDVPDIPAVADAGTTDVNTEADAEVTIQGSNYVAGSQIPPWSASHSYTNLYGMRNVVTATVSGNYRLTDDASDSDIRHVVLDFGDAPFPVLEGQSIGIIPPGTDAGERLHHARQYSLASPRDGERPRYNNVSITVKRVVQDYDGNAVKGVCSNYVCDLQKGDKVQVIGPFGHTFLMPNHPGANIIMICTGTGSAPMRAMTERRRRKHLEGQGDARGKLMLFFGARCKEELPYFGPLNKLPKDFIDINFAFSRTPGQPKKYVQDVMRERLPDLLALLKDEDTYIYVCGVKGMESGVLEVLQEAATAGGMVWPELHATLRQKGRLHLETY